MLNLNFKVLTDENVDDLGSFDLTTTCNLHDPRFGDNDCQRCDKKTKCPGHFAILNLGFFLVHPTYESILKKKIATLCVECGSTSVTTSIKAEIKKCLSCGDLSKTKKLSDVSDIDLKRIRKNFIRFKLDEYKFIISKILIPPPGIRPSNNVEWPNDLARSYRELTGLVRDKKKKITPQYKLNVTKSYKKLIGVLSDLLSGKEGIFRSLMLGKRVDNSARAVIVGDPYIAVDEIFVPKCIAKGIITKERCNQYNINRLKDMTKSDDVFWPDTNALIKYDEVVIGQIYDRSSINGDMVLLNRQPSLSEGSILSFKLKIRDNDHLVIAINPIVASTFNADFDGDEMNIKGGMNIESQAELHSICNVLKHDTIYPIQDVITGAYCMTDVNVTISVEMFMDMIMIAGCDIPTGFNKNNYKPMTGWDLIKLSLPCNVNVDDLIYTNADKKIICSVIPGKIKTVYGGDGRAPMDIYQPKISKFYETLQLIVLSWISTQGFTIGLSDCMWNSNDINTKNTLINVMRYDNDDHYAEDYEIFNEWSLRTSNENYMNNSLYRMTKSGGKGDITKMTQIMGVVGQQYNTNDDVWGGKEKKSLTDYGFVRSSFIDGLNVKEYAKHTMSARGGLMGTGDGTAKTGYIMRRLSMFSSDMIANYFGDVIDNDGSIVSFRSHG